MNAIPEAQNTERQLDRLAAQRHIYSSAKSIQALEIALTVVGGVACSLGAILRPEIKAYAALYGLVVGTLDYFLLTAHVKALRLQAAKVQELFDCDVLQLPWHELQAGRRPDAEAVVAASMKFKRRDSECVGLHDWYPVAVGKMPIHKARLVCQRSNCRWDAELRRRYGGLTLGIAATLVVVLPIYGLARHLALDEFLLGVVMPLGPILLWGVREYRENVEAAATGDSLKVHAERVWERAISGTMSEDELTKEARDLQDEIFDQRRRSSLVYDWLYWRLRQGQEQQMLAAAEERLSELEE